MQVRYQTALLPDVRFLFALPLGGVGGGIIQ